MRDLGLNLLGAIVIPTVLTAVLSFGLTRFLSKKFKAMGITGVDIHKSDKPVTAEMGGLAVLISCAFGASIFYMLDPELPAIFFAGFITIILVGIVGVIDDLVALRQRYKPFLVAVASAPLILASFGTTGVYLPLLGTIPFGIFYPLLVVPLGVATSANLSNMLAGFNGLEAGCTLIALGTLTFLSVVLGKQLGIALGSLFLAGYLGFFVLNWYPAKIFPGDTGTLMAGAAIVTIGFASGLVFAAIALSIPAALDFTLKILTKRPFAARSVHGNTIISSNGTLSPPNYPALPHAFMKLAPLSEKDLVASILALEAIFAVIGAAITLAL